MIRMMSSRARTSPEGTRAPELTSVEIRHRHRRFNRLSSVTDRATDSDLRTNAQPLVPATYPVLAEAQAPARRLLTVPFLCLAVFLIAAYATFMAAYFHDHPPTKAGTASEVPVTRARNAGIDMRAEPQGDSILVSWKRDSPALQSAADGVLKIDDGTQHQQMALDRAELATGLILYKPVSSNVVFRLELREKEEQHVAESVEVVNTSAHAASPEPKTQPNATETANDLPAPAIPANDLYTIAIPQQQGANKRDTAKSGSESVSRSSPKRAAPVQPARRSSGKANDTGLKPPSLPVGSVRVPQPSFLAQQILPKPPVETSSKPAQGTNRATAPAPDTAAPAVKPSPAVRESASKDATQSTPVAGSMARAAGTSPAASQLQSYVPARPVKWAAPDAKSLGLSGISRPTDVAVKVRIDESGHVSAAHALLDGSVHDETVRAAVAAAVKQWIFEPAKMQGKSVPSDDTIVVHLDPKR